MSTTQVIIPPTRNPQEASIRHILMIWLTRCSENQARALRAWARKHRRGTYRRCGRGRGLPTERPDRRHGGPRDNRPAPGRGTTPPSGTAVHSLRGVHVNAETLDAIAARLGV